MPDNMQPKADDENRRRLSDTLTNHTCGQAHGAVVERILSLEHKIQQQCREITKLDADMTTNKTDLVGRVTYAQAAAKEKEIEDAIDQRVSFRVFSWAIGIIASVYVGTIGILYGYTREVFEQYLRQTQISNEHVIKSVNDIDARLTRSLAEFSVRQIKWNDDVDLKIDMIKDRVARIEITISRDNKND